MRDTVSGAIAIPKARLGMCPSLAEPDLSGFPRNVFQNVSRETSHQIKKFFDPAIFQKCW